MTVGKDQAEKNIGAFMDKYGSAGFLELYFTNYLFELLLAYLRSHSKKREYDGGYQYHFHNRDEFVSPDDERKFRQDLRKECAKKAKIIVSKLQEKGLIAKFGTDLGAITKQATEMVEQYTKEIFESVFHAKWGED